MKPADWTQERQRGRIMALIPDNAHDPDSRGGLSLGRNEMVDPREIQVLMSARPGWQGDGYYVLEEGGHYYPDRIVVMIKNGTIRKRPRGQNLVYRIEDGARVRKVTRRGESRD